MQDFVAATEMVIFLPGQTRRCANFTIVDDDVVEDQEERFTVVIDETPDGVTEGDQPSTTVTIMDDDSKQRKGFRCLKS
jgi:hypothetical protein